MTSSTSLSPPAASGSRRAVSGIMVHLRIDCPISGPTSRHEREPRMSRVLAASSCLGRMSFASYELPQEADMSESDRPQDLTDAQAVGTSESSERVASEAASPLREGV